MLHQSAAASSRSVPCRPPLLSSLPLLLLLSPKPKQTSKKNKHKKPLSFLKLVDRDRLCAGNLTLETIDVKSQTRNSAFLAKDMEVSPRSWSKRASWRLFRKRELYSFTPGPSRVREDERKEQKRNESWFDKTLEESFTLMLLVGSPNPNQPCNTFPSSTVLCIPTHLVSDAAPTPGLFDVGARPAFNDLSSGNASSKISWWLSKWGSYKIEEGRVAPSADMTQELQWQAKWVNPKS